MHIPTHTPNVIKYSNFLISISFNFRTIFFNYLTPILIKKQSRVYLFNQIHSHNTRTNNQMSILRVNRSKTKHCVLHNGMITLNSLPDIFKVNVSFSMFKSKVRNIYLEKYQKILMLGATMIVFFFLTCLQLRFFKCNCFWFCVFFCEISNYLFCAYNQDNQECYCQLDVFLVSELLQ